MKSTGEGSLGGVTAPPLSDGGRPARRAPRFASPGGWWWAVWAHVRGWLLSALQSRRCVHPVGVTDGGLRLRVMSELAPTTLGRDEFTSDLSRYHARWSCFVLCFDGFVPGQLEGVFICKGSLLIDHQKLTTIPGPSNNWSCAAISTSSC